MVAASVGPLGVGAGVATPAALRGHRSPPAIAASSPGVLPPGVSAEVRATLAEAPAKRAAVIVHLVDPAARGQAGALTGAPVAPPSAPGRIGRRGAAGPLVAQGKAAFRRSSPGVMAALEEAVTRGSAARVAPLWIVNAVAVEADRRLIAELAGRPDVWAITADHAFPSPGAGADPRPRIQGPSRPPAEAPSPWNLEAIHAPDVWRRLGFDGAGVTVAILDTGVDYHHPALTTRYRGYRGRVDPDNAGNWWCPVELCGTGQRYPADSAGHGTHVLGTIVGEGTGVAPGATWIAAMVCDAEVCHDRFILAALEWLIDTGTPLPRAAAVNMSLEKRGPTDWVMKEAIDTVVDAGVVAIVAAGNRGQVFSPGIFTTTITVGALNDEGDVPVWSGRGVSPWFEHKPDVVAPGVGIVSTLRGGGIGPSTGTSMATPHVTGASALLLSAKSALGPGEVKRILRETSDRDFTTVPDDAQGWGLVNAYGAVASILDVGTLEGTVASTAGGAPSWGSAVAVGRPDGTPVTGASTDSDGQFRLAVMPGDYLVTASAFGYVTQTVAAAVETGRVTRLDFALAPRTDGGWINGRVTEASSGALLAGRILVAGTPVTGTLVDGFYSLKGMPPGTYRLVAESPGHKVGAATATLAPGGTARVDFALASAPRVLLVDGDAWRFSGAMAYYEASLDRLEYLYDTWRVLDPGPGNAPSAADLARYDVVIWSHDISSPGYIGAGGAIDAYLRGGGRLLVAGQDVACNDSGSSPCARPEARQPYLRDRLLVDFVADSAPGNVIRGRRGTPMEGITATLNGGTSLDNQFAPDVLAAADPLRASVIIDYDGGGGAGTLAEVC
ncbi:MAG: S8 family serine peptidase, partial [Anaerolineae bacterium]